MANRLGTLTVLLSSMAFLAVSAMAVAPPATDVLTEGAAANWGSWAQEATATVTNDATLVKMGENSLRFDTTGGFDTSLWTPVAKNAAWDFTTAGSGGVAFWIYPVNTNTAFQGNFPDFRFYTSDGNYFQYQPTTDPLSGNRNVWQYMTIPFNGSSTWTRTVVGSPSLSNINWIEIHCDTWEAGFSLYFDAMTFNVTLAAPDGLTAVAGNAKVGLKWQKWTDPGGLFQSYAVYRKTSAFTSTVGLTPLTTIANINTTTYTDMTAVNGTNYYYAVTVKMTNASETSTVTSVGPRKPRNETDLQLTCISRTPRYPRYAPNYSGYTVTEPPAPGGDPNGFGPYNFTAATSLGQGQTASTQRWPNTGDTVTYTATVRNRGTTTYNNTISGTWQWDGTNVATPTQAVNLAPGATTTFVYTHTWDGAQHSVNFSFTAPGDARATNNSVMIWTKAAPFLTYVDTSAIEEFRDHFSPNWTGNKTNDLIDWLQNHAVKDNAMFLAASSAKRMFYDVLAVTDDYAADPATPETIYFGVFPFRYYYTGGDPRGSGYYSSTEDIDYGLLHEMGHQLGLIDLYRLDMSGDNNYVNAQGYGGPDCLMHSCSNFYSVNSAGAMTHWQDVVHGYFGQYLYSLPQHVQMHFTDINGSPLDGATVTLYQKCERPGLGEVITTQAKASGITDPNGNWMLPNVHIDQNLVPPLPNGDVLPDNPFGYVACIGTNGDLLLKVARGGFVDYAWLDITQVNNAYWAGQTTTATFTRQMAIGGAIQHYPPADLAELNAHNWSNWVYDGAGTVIDDTSRKHTGSGNGSIKFDTNGGYDNYVRYPLGMLAQWNLSAVTQIRFWAYATNPNGSFQSSSPWVRLGNFQDGYFQWTPNGDVLNSAINQWYEFVVPIAGDANWTRTTNNGTPSLSNINYFEVHADTWGGGFDLWLDGVRFSPQPTPLYGDMNCDGLVNNGDIDAFIMALTNTAGYIAAYPQCDIVNGDMNHDGFTNNGDIDAFITKITGG